MKSVENYLGLNYRTSVYRDDDGDVIVKVPELPGCVADGKTPNEAFENLRSAMRSWIESRMAAGLQVPEPRSAEEFSGRLLVRMPRYLHERLSQQAEGEGISLNQYVVSLLSEASAPAQAQNLPNNAANIAAWLRATGMVCQGFMGPAFIGPTALNPSMALLGSASPAYFSYNYDCAMAEPLQSVAATRLVLSRFSVGQGNQKETGLKPQIVPKQQVA